MYRRLIPLAVLGMLVVLSTGCFEPPKQEQQRRDSIKERAATFDRAEKAAPLPYTTNFPLRKALVEFTKRQDEVNHPWYIYILAQQQGNVVGYYVGRTVPINACDFLSSTQDKDGNTVLAAPSLDGLFYGGAGSSSGCDAWFFFDAATNALIQIRGVGFFAADQPLKIDAPRFKIQQ